MYILLQISKYKKKIYIYIYTFGKNSFVLLYEIVSYM